MGAGHPLDVSFLNPDVTDAETLTVSSQDTLTYSLSFFSSHAVVKTHVHTVRGAAVGVVTGASRLHASLPP